MAAPDLKALGRYTIQRVLGRGAMGVVYEGLDPKLNRKVAIKTILRSHLDDATAQSFAERFVQEAHAVARLNHPHIVQVHDFGEEGDVAYLVMEFIRGRELQSCFDARERFEPKEAVRIMDELASALEFAHQAGVIHRDVKPANVMLDSQGHAKLTDFGVARVQDVTRSHATQAGTLVGTPAYMSPEQITGTAVDRRTDVFAAGIILYQFLTGELPFSGGGPWTIAKKIMQDQPALPSSIDTSVSPLFDAVVGKALAKEPDRRYQSMHAFAVALKRALEGKPEEDDAERTVFNPEARAERHTTPAVRTPAVPAQPGTQDAEVEFWRSIKDSSEADDYELYLKKFPEGLYADLARRKASRLGGGEQTRREAQAKLEAEARAREVEENARREAEEEEKRQAAERAQLQAEQKKRAAEDKARLEAEARARREAEERKREAEAQLRKQQERAEEHARREAELKKREAALKAQAAAGGRKTSPAVPIAIAILVLGLAGGGYYFFARDDEQAQRRIAEMQKELEAAKQRAAELENAKKREEEARVVLEKARKAEQEAKRSDDAARQKQLAEERARAEAEARKTAEARIAQEKAPAAEKARAEKLAQEKVAAEKVAAERRAAEEREKLARERAAAERAAAEKVKADQVAAERAAAKAAALPKAAVPAPAAASASRFPQAGDTWTYRYTDQKRTGRSAPRTLTVSVARANDSAIVERFAVEGGPSGEWTHSKGAYLVPLGAPVFSPYLPLFDDIAPGARFGRVFINEPGCSGDYNCHAAAEVAGREQVTVPSGTFDCVKIVVEHWWKPGGGHASGQGANAPPGARQLTIWYSPKAKRAIKFSSRLTGGLFPPIEADFDLELVSYQLK